MKIIILLFSIFLGFIQSSAAKECNPQPKSNFKFFKGKYLLTRGRSTRDLRGCRGGAGRRPPGGGAGCLGRQ